LITIDTLRRDHVGAYAEGARGLTPALDALAAEGLLHRSAYTTMPTTGPAHLSAFTGLYPSELGARRNGEPLPPGLAPREAAALLRRRGYATAAFVTTRLLSPKATGLRGFEIYDAPRAALRPGERAVDAALAWLDAQTRRPVLLWVHLYDPHAPYGTADEKRRSFPVDPSTYGWIRRPARYASAPQRAEMEERYARGVRSADAALGRLVVGVRAALDSPPLVLVAADHGESFTEHLAERRFAYDHGKFLDGECVLIPLVVAGPGVAPGSSAGAVSLRDLYTTILETAGVADVEAAGADRRDLRRPSDERRLVRIERRTFRTLVPDSVRTHGAAAADGARLVIVAEDGSPTTEPDEATGDLLEAARSQLGERDSAPAPRPLEAEIREALRDLGYAE
jgi:arylsulfatase A-like enzyme